MPVTAILAKEFGAPDVLKLTEKDLPPLADGQVRIKVGAAGVNPMDTYQRLGPSGPWGATPHLLPALPFTPGKDGAGTIVEVGSAVKGLTVGQRVYTTASVTGTCAAEAICSADTVHPLPDGISFLQGACIGVPCMTAYHALKYRASVSAGQWVFVHGGSGAVGTAAIQLAKYMQCKVAATAGTPQGLEAVKAAGADVVLNHREEGYIEKALEAAPGGYDAILEMAAHANLLKDMKITAKRSCVLIIGSKPEAVGFNPRLTMPKEVDIRGVFLFAQTPEEKAETHTALFAAMDKGALKPVVGLELPLGDAAKAQIEVMGPSSGGANGNIVLVPPS